MWVFHVPSRHSSGVPSEGPLQQLPYSQTVPLAVQADPSAGRGSGHPGPASLHLRQCQNVPWPASPAQGRHPQFPSA